MKSFLLLFYLQNREAIGITGPIRFIRDYKTRVDIYMDIVEYHRIDGVFKRVAQWDRIDRLVVTRSSEELKSQKAFNIQTKVFSVVSRIGMPYLELAENASSRQGNDRYEGFVKDFMDEISKLKNFTYKLYLVHGNHHGTHDHVTGKWTGIVGDLLEGVCFIQEKIFQFKKWLYFSQIIYFHPNSIWFSTFRKPI